MATTSSTTSKKYTTTSSLSWPKSTTKPQSITATVVASEERRYKKSRLDPMTYRLNWYDWYTMIVDQGIIFMIAGSFRAWSVAALSRPSLLALSSRPKLDCISFSTIFLFASVPMKIVWWLLHFLWNRGRSTRHRWFLSGRWWRPDRQWWSRIGTKRWSCSSDWVWWKRWVSPRKSKPWR